MPRPSRRTVVSLLTVTAAFVAGMAFDAVGHREAHAQALATSTILVPEGGLIFRATDGTTLARLSRDAHGASFEVFEDQAGSTQVHSSSELHANPYVIDEQDPWKRGASPKERPGPGF
jgi:hypothetical protein